MSQDNVAGLASRPPSIDSAPLLWMVQASPWARFSIPTTGVREVGLHSATKSVLLMRETLNARTDNFLDRHADSLFRLNV